MPSDIDIAIIGAGAAGLTAAIFAAQYQPHLKIMLLDGASTIGSKILVSGGGRCNVTNAVIQPSDFHAPNRLVSRIIRRFDQPATIQWFESLGVELKQESTGKLFPVSNKARTILQALLQRCRDLEIVLLTKHRVQSIAFTEPGFCIETEQGQINAQHVILATGGQSLPKSGSDGKGWVLAKQLGHSVTPTYPALVPLILESTFFHAGLSGISHDATITTQVNKKVIDRRTGSLLWTHLGISGPVVLDASRFWVMAKGQGQEVRVTMSCFPDKTNEEVEQWIGQVSRQPGRKTVGNFLAQQLPTRLVQALCLMVDQEHQDLGEPSPKNLESMPMNQLPQLKRKTLTKVLTELHLPVVGNRGWNFAEVTSGGIPLSEINPKTMMSRKVPGLYLIGEMLDCDGRIGGFNFQWAWSTGFIAGTSASANLAH